MSGLRLFTGGATHAADAGWLTDPKTFSRPFKIAFDLGRNPEPDYEILEYACVEGEQDLQHYTVSAGGAKADK